MNLRLYSQCILCKSCLRFLKHYDRLQIFFHVWETSLWDRDTGLYKMYHTYNRLTSGSVSYNICVIAERSNSMVESRVLDFKVA